MEEWRKTEGFPGYLISNRGRVKSLARTVPRLYMGKDGTRQIAERIMRPQRTGRNRNYLKVNLFFEPRMRKQVSVHRLVAIAFIGSPIGQANQVNHKSGDTFDNTVENLEWVTHSENLLHAARVLGTVKGVYPGHLRRRGLIT